MLVLVVVLVVVLVDVLVVVRSIDFHTPSPVWIPTAGLVVS